MLSSAPLHASPSAPADGAGALPATAGLQDMLRPQDRELANHIDAQLRDGHPWLRFQPHLEQRFIQETGDARLRTLLIAGTLVAFVLNLFLLADRAMIPDRFDDALRLRVWVYTPIVLVGMWIMSRLPQLLLRELLAVGASLLAGLLHLGLAVSSESPHALAYTTGLVMIIIYANVFVRTRFWLSVATCLALLAFYVVAVWWMPSPNLALAVPIGLIHVSASVFTLYYLYGLEHDERQNYLLAMRQRLLQKELNAGNRELERVSRVDPLTRLANRRYFDTYTEQLWERARRDDAELAILMLDVDCFKRYNDRHGHPAGDACLIAVARALRSSLRRPGDLIARYGGEEFIAVLHRTSPQHAASAAERVREAVEQLALHHGDSHVSDVVTVSVGVATLKPSDRQASVQHLIALADEALYHAKNRGRNRVWVSQLGGTGFRSGGHA